MPSTQLTENLKGNVEPVNKQPPASFTMSTDPNGQEQRAKRFRGGCLVRHCCSNSWQLLIRSLGMHGTLWVLRLIVLHLRRGAFKLMQPAVRLRGVFLRVIPQF
jgi:hypothetical protein